ncbi:putative membrane protein [Bisgaardia hudsonensis]|uniref:UPF0283 membrane protein EV697_101523 n=1 Tax=Bisgaardia hudsonensis TaxID=109472 RepID=A0A4R2N3I2_9PAST|nr:TIGR01620 family protein [Bisgaardia hudsonensis]QLB12824.1 TIGR01620 family protein [Bisgaardia hudsonensis]TCP14382.1 putative membrane protein [Bisgaardia hudsonensis]
MQKQIFSKENIQDSKNDNNGEPFVPRQEFDEASVKIEDEVIDSESLQGELLTEEFSDIVKPKPKWWKKVFVSTVILFIVATVAQSIQWIINSWQQNQWLSLAFSIVAFSVLLLGLTMIIQEMRHLVALRKRMLLQEKSEALSLESAVDLNTDSQYSFEEGQKLCLSVVDNIKMPKNTLELVEWKQLINESYSAQEVVHLFSETVLSPIDKQAKKLVTKNAVECAVIIAVSPLAVVDMFFLAWRNIRLINQLAKIYGIELGYVSRLRLLKMVFLNMAFAGATEIVQDIGMDWLSQDITAKVSSRIAQGIGVGLLTARLGIKAMEFCRPIVFEKNEKPRLSHIQKELLTTLKSTILRENKIKENVKM